MKYHEISRGFACGLILGLALTVLPIVRVSPKIKVGMKATNGYCEGVITSINRKDETVVMSRAQCKNLDSPVWGVIEQVKNLKEIK